LQAAACRQHAEEERACKLAEKAAKDAEKKAIREARKVIVDAKRASKGLPKLRTRIPSKSLGQALDNGDNSEGSSSWVVKKATQTRAVVRLLRFR
jgi:hypothetical protein